MKPTEPQVSFLLPYRFFTDDKEFLGKNLIRQITKQLGTDGVKNLQGVQLYRVELGVHAFEPVKVPVSALQLKRLLKPVMPYGNCIDPVTTRFTQSHSSTSLPVINFRLYF